MFNIFHRGFWTPPLFFIGLKMFFFAGFPESINIYTDRKVRKIYFFRKKIFYFYIHLIKNQRTHITEVSESVKKAGAIAREKIITLQLKTAAKLN